VIVDQRREARAARALAREALDLADTGHVLGQRGGHAREALLLIAVRLAEPAAQPPHQHPDAGHHDRHDQEQPPVVDDHQRRRDQGVAQGHHRHEGDVLDADADHLHVRGDAGDQATDGRAREVTHRHAQQVRVDVVAQIVDDRLAQPQREAIAVDEAELRERGQRQEAGDARQRAGHVAPRDRPGEDLRHRPGDERQLDRAQHHQTGQRVAQARVGARAAVEAADDAPVQRALQLPIAHASAPRPCSAAARA
jgi:hypothetical protein